MSNFLNGVELVIRDQSRLEKPFSHLVDQDGHISNGQAETFYQFSNRHGPTSLFSRLNGPHYVVRKALLLRDVPESLTIHGDLPGKDFAEAAEERKPRRERAAGGNDEAEAIKRHRSITQGEQRVALFPDLRSSCSKGIRLREGKPVGKPVADPRLNVLGPRAFDHPRNSFIGGLAVFTLLFLNVRIEYDNGLVPLVGHSKCGRSFR